MAKCFTMTPLQDNAALSASNKTYFNCDLPVFRLDSGIAGFSFKLFPVALDSHTDELRPGSDAGLSEQLLQHGLHEWFRHSQTECNLFVGLTAKNAPENLTLASRQRRRDALTC